MNGVDQHEGHGGGGDLHYVKSSKPHVCRIR